MSTCASGSGTSSRSWISESSPFSKRSASGAPRSKTELAARHTAAPPIPSPTSNRPPLIVSSVVTSRAIAKGGWSTKLETSGPSLHLVVRPAMAVSTLQPSNHRESGSHGLARCSATQTESAPASSKRPAQSSNSAIGRSCWRKTPNDLIAGTYQRHDAASDGSPDRIRPAGTNEDRTIATPAELAHVRQELCHGQAHEPPGPQRNIVGYRLTARTLGHLGPTGAFGASSLARHECLGGVGLSGTGTS